MGENVQRAIGAVLGMGAAAWERVVVAIGALAGVTYLGATGSMDGQAVATIYAAVVGYVLGQGAGQTSERLRAKLNGEPKPNGGSSSKPNGGS